MMLAGPVITEEDDERYDGADAPTNNAGELIAMIRMIQESVRVAQPGDHVEVQSDSMVALMAALGARKQTRRKKGPRSKSKKKIEHGSATAATSNLHVSEAEARNDEDNAPQSKRALWTRMERDSG